MDLDSDDIRFIIFKSIIFYTAKYCGNPGSPAHGGSQGSNFYEMGRVNYYCNGGYTLVGSSYRICRSYGWESSIPTCKRKQQLMARAGVT